MRELEPTRTYSNPTATDVLRRLLDERGVEWDADDEAMDDGSLSQVTYWHCNGIEWSADGRGEYLAFDAVQLLTPAQAIAATLGSCNCSDNCTNSERTETCHVESSIIDTYEYNRWEYELSCGHTIIWEDSEPPRYCPNCGRRIEQ